MSKAVLHFQLARSGARCDYGLFLGASSDNFTTLSPLSSKACALKMYLNDTFTTLKLNDISIWMKVIDIYLNKIKVVRFLIFIFEERTVTELRKSNSIRNMFSDSFLFGKSLNHFTCMYTSDSAILQKMNHVSY